MKPEKILVIGIAIAVSPLILMSYIHEYLLNSILFLVGILVIGFAYVKDSQLSYARNSGNTERVNETIQKLNDILWGKKEK